MKKSKLKKVKLVRKRLQNIFKIDTSNISPKKVLTFVKELE